METPVPLLSVVVLADSQYHFLFQTLESLSFQEVKNFEVILLDAREPSEWLKFQADFPISTWKMEGKTVGSAMNQALFLAKGSYVQFLSPGERFLSHQATAYIGQIALENNRPELIYGAFLEKDPTKPPRAAIFPLNLVEKGIAPTNLHAHWFLKNALDAIGGFNPHYNSRPSFDALLSLLQQRARAVYAKRVFVDCERRRTTALETAGFAFETCKILYRHFGLWPALRWLFVQDRALLIRRASNWLKHAFWGKTS